MNKAKQGREVPVLKDLVKSLADLASVLITALRGRCRRSRKG